MFDQTGKLKAVWVSLCITCLTNPVLRIKNFPARGVILSPEPFCSGKSTILEVRRMLLTF